MNRNPLIYKQVTGVNGSSIAAKLMHVWKEYKGTILVIIMLLMAVYTTLSLGKQFWRLVWDTSWLGAVDLKSRYYEVHGFFAGEQIKSPYPPASFAILWPFLGWIPENLFRQIWAFFYIGTFAWLFYLLARVSKADNRIEYAFVCMCLLSMNAAHATVGVGQLGLLVVASLITGIILINNNKEGILARDIAGSLLFIAALVKPTISAPFFWIILFSGRMRPALLVVAGYISLYIFSASFQDAGLIELTRKWLGLRSTLAAHPVKGSINISYVATSLQESNSLPHINTKISLILLMLMGIWIYYFRRVDMWILLGVTGIFSRLWTYHHTYDDVVILFTMIALFRIAKDIIHSDATRLVSGALLFATITINFIPAYVLKVWQAPWPFIYTLLHYSVWAAILLFLQYITIKLNISAADNTARDRFA